MIDGIFKEGDKFRYKEKCLGKYETILIIRGGILGSMVETKFTPAMILLCDDAELEKI